MFAIVLVALVGVGATRVALLGVDEDDEIPEELLRDPTEARGIAVERMEGLDKPDFLITAEGSDIFALPTSPDDETPDASTGDGGSSRAEDGEDEVGVDGALSPGHRGPVTAEGVYRGAEASLSTAAVADTDCSQGLTFFWPHQALKSSAPNAQAEVAQDADLPRDGAEAKAGLENPEMWDDCNPGLGGGRVPIPNVDFPVDAPEIRAEDDGMAYRDVVLVPPDLTHPSTVSSGPTRGATGHTAQMSSAFRDDEDDYGSSRGPRCRPRSTSSRHLCPEEDDSVSTFIMADDGGNTVTITDGDCETDDEEARARDQGVLQSKTTSKAAAFFGKLTDVKWLVGSGSDTDAAASDATSPQQSGVGRSRDLHGDSLGVGASGSNSVFAGLWGGASEEPSSLGPTGGVGGSSGASSGIFGLTLSPEPSESQLCSICFEHEKNAVFLGCGHSSICYSCAIDTYVNNREKCPFCRRHIDQVLIIGEVTKDASGRISAKVIGPEPSLFSSIFYS